MRSRCIQTLFASCVLLSAGFASAETPAEFLDRYQAEQRRSSPSFAASTERGEQFFNATHGNDWSCSSCHTKNPANRGKHATTGKSIDPMAPAVNPERLASMKSVEKWFTRNCKDVLGRVCSPAEKADVIAYLISVAR